MQLSFHAEALLKRIYAAYAGQPFEEGKEELFRPVNLCRAELRLSMMELREAGMLAALQKMWGEKLYYIPEEKLSILQNDYFPYTPCFQDSSEVHIQMEEGSGLAGELFRALLFVAREGLPLTAKGSIHKKNISRLTSKLSIQEKHLRGLTVEYPFPESYPLSCAIMVDLMLSLGLLEREENAYALNEEVLDSWLNLSEPAMADRIYSVVMNRYGSSEPASQHFRYLIARPEFINKEWVSVSELLDWMEASALVLPVHREGLAETSLAWLEFLTGCGWCQIGSKPDGGLCFRWVKVKPQRVEFSSVTSNPSTSSSEEFIVQPDFEVLVPPEVPYAVRWTLACCAELLYMDSMWGFRLSREQLEIAYEQGMLPYEVISWLDSHTMGGLPDEVRLVMDQWGKDIGRTAFADVLLLSCKEEEDADMIAAHPRLQGYIYRLGPLHFSIPKEHEAYVRTELSKAELVPDRGVQDREMAKVITPPTFHKKRGEQPLDYSLPRTTDKQGLIRINTPFLYLQKAPLDTEGSLLPGLEAVPSMWSKEWHQYHNTTAQKIMEQALNWGIKVRISLEDQIYEFIPSRIVGNPWRVLGYILQNTEEWSEVELPVGSWKEMQLLIPYSTRIPPSVRAHGYVMMRESTNPVDQHYT